MSGGSDIQQFLQQPFIGPVFSMMCFFGVVFVVMVALLIYVRRRRAMKSEMSSYSAPVNYGSLEHDMPDLGLLVHAPPNIAASAVEAVSPVPIEAQPPPPPRAARKGTFAVTPKDGAPTEAVEVMTILRDVVDGHLIVQMGERVFQNVNSDADFRDRFSRVLRELGDSSGQQRSQPAPPAPPMAVASQTEPIVETDITDDNPVNHVPESPARPDVPRPAAPPAPRPASSVPAPRPGVRLPGDLPSYKLDDNPVVKKGRKLQMKPVQELNVANAIESYLQFKLQNAPEYAARSIHIYPSPDGGVSIEVDGRYYDAVGDIEDTGVREFIANAIQEWQERH